MEMVGEISPDGFNTADFFEHLAKAECHFKSFVVIFTSIYSLRKYRSMSQPFIGKLASGK